MPANIFGNLVLSVTALAQFGHTDITDRWTADDLFETF